MIRRSRPRLPLLAPLLLAAACAAPQTVPTAPMPAPVTAPVPATTMLTAAGLLAERPRPHPVPEPLGFTRAVSRGTRTRTGEPGANYWQQYARYQFEAALDPAARRLTGRGTVRYLNRSPDTLRTLYLHLHTNLHAPDVQRNETVEITEATRLTRLTAQGTVLRELAGNDTAAGYSVNGTTLRLRLPRALVPDDSATMEVGWSYTVPIEAPRGGLDEKKEVWFLSYWYPQMAVYDDVVGWHTDPYLGNSEFYMGFADYDVNLTVPAGWLVNATGELQNGDAVLSRQTRARLAEARRGAAVVHVVTAGDRGAGKATARGTGGRAGTLTWRYQAQDVRDFSFATSPHYLWDATVAVTGGMENGRPDTADIHAFYRPGSPNWENEGVYARHSIEFLSRFLWPYPYSHMTAIDGPGSCGGMEFPMQTCLGGARDTLSLYGVTAHEFAHMWFPMQVGSDEKRYAWQDEGLTRFNDAHASMEFFRGYNRLPAVRDQYLAMARSGHEVELMRHGDRYGPGAAYGIASYSKMATNMVALRAILGEETFTRAYREYGRRWLGRHPKPTDLWNTFEHVSGRELDWFWRTWWFETWTLDQAVTSVRAAGDSTEIVLEDRGLAPMPSRLAISRADGTVQRLEVPVDVWLAGARRHVVRVASQPAVTRVQLDPEGLFPDIDRTNDSATP